MVLVKYNLTYNYSVTLLKFIAPRGSMKSIFRLLGRFFLIVAAITLMLLTAWNSVQAVSCPSYIVSNTNDSGTGSLRGTIAAVAGTCGTINFDPSLSGKTIILTGGSITLDKNLIIDASSLPTPVTVSGNNSNRIFYILNVSVGINVTIDSLILKDGYQGSVSPAQGGAIYTHETVKLRNLTFTGNHTNATQSEGGAIYNDSDSNLTIENSTFINNSATSQWSYGGAIYNNTAGKVVIANSTFTGNSTGGNTEAKGGAIYNLGNLYVTNSTLYANSAAGSGGGNIMSPVLARLSNNIVAGSSLMGGNCGVGSVFDGTFGGYNLSDDASCLTSFLAPSSNINLGSLDYYGGKTKTFPLLAGSSALDATGNNMVCKISVGDPAYYGAGGRDQRGVIRPASSTGICDIGAFEYDPVPEVLLGESSPLNGEILHIGPTTISIQFSKDMLHDGDDQAANNTDNYLLVSAGPNGNFDTSSCLGGLMTDDISVAINSATYYPATFRTLLSVNGGTPLPSGSYRLFICATTSITDLYGLKLGYGLTDSKLSFTVLSGTAAVLPVTGFAPGVITMLPNQPVEKEYTLLSDLAIKIPRLNVEASIIGVPATSSGWDITWLGNKAGYLYGSAFPTWTGNSVITGHVWNADNTPGIFVNLKSLKYGDRFQITLFGKSYIYEVRENSLISSQNIKKVFKSEKYSWVTLLTCEDFNSNNITYDFRRIVRAVWVYTN